jgi:hypothetical protein
MWEIKGKKKQNENKKKTNKTVGFEQYHCLGILIKYC